MSIPASSAPTSPPSVIPGGNVSHLQAKKATIDWLSFSYTNASKVEDCIAALAMILPAPIHIRDSGGKFYYASGLKLFCQARTRLVHVANVFYDDFPGNKRLLVQISGKGCSLISNWEEVKTLLSHLSAKITRIDIAVDFSNGEYTVDDAVSMYRAGMFANKGRTPSINTAGDWIKNVYGRTVYIGKRNNGKTLRCYESAKKLGDLRSNATRWELELGGHGRDLPHEILIDPAPYFAGGYPALAKVLPSATAAINARKKQRSAELAHQLFHLKHSYGAVLAQALSLQGANAEVVIEALSRASTDHPKASLLLPQSWEDVHATLSRLIANHPPI